MRYRLFVLVCALALLSSGNIRANGTLSFGVGATTPAPAVPSTVENRVWTQAVVNSFLSRSAVDSLILSFGGSGYLGTLPFAADYGGTANAALSASFIRNLSVINVRAFGEIEGGLVDGLSRTVTGLRAGWSYGDIGYSILMGSFFSRSFFPDNSWNAGLSARGDLSLSPSIVASFGASAGGELYDTGDTGWSATVGPGITWYFGSLLVLDLSVTGTVRRSTILTPLSDYGATGSAGSLLVQADSYREVQARFGASLAAGRSVRFHLAVPVEFRVMEYGHVTGSLMSAPDEWTVTAVPALDIGVDIDRFLSLHVVPAVEMVSSNSDYRRGTTVSGSIYLQYGF